MGKNLKKKQVGPKAFTSIEKKAFYRAVYERRDIRREFLPKAIPPTVLKKILKAAHHAGSVGFMQPWNFIVIQDPSVKQKVKEIFIKENNKAVNNYSGGKKDKYRAMKLEGIMEAPVNICVTCDPKRGGAHVLGRNTIKQTDFFSTCCAIQNLWLAARVENIGVGWVSILDNGLLKKALKIPPHIHPVAYLCVGYVSGFVEKPMLETIGWRKRMPLENLVFNDYWARK